MSQLKKLLNILVVQMISKKRKIKFGDQTIVI